MTGIFRGEGQTALHLRSCLAAVGNSLDQKYVERGGTVSVAACVISFRVSGAPHLDSLLARWCFLCALYLTRCLNNAACYLNGSVDEGVRLIGLQYARREVDYVVKLFRGARDTASITFKTVKVDKTEALMPLRERWVLSAGFECAVGVCGVAIRGLQSARSLGKRSWGDQRSLVVVEAAKDLSSSHDVLLDLFRRMEDFFKRFKAYSQSFVTTELAEVLVKVVVKVLNILSVATKEVKRNQIMGKKNIENALGELDTVIQGEHYTATTQVLQDTSQLRRDMEAIGAAVQQMVNSREEEECP
ncbi:hypothetical protein EI94DRAFT_1700226 [Lactarius quietus]|nr:hypothetical protein EI94DRAFT_1700226 [Lactarius quietus]